MLIELLSRLPLRQALSLRELLCNDPENFQLSCANDAIANITNWATGLAGSIAFLFLIWGGLLYLTSGGNSGQTEEAKKTITWALIGLAVIVFAYALVRYFASLFLTVTF